MTTHLASYSHIEKHGNKHQCDQQLAHQYGIHLSNESWNIKTISFKSYAKLEQNVNENE